jgi:hypothetical protein
MPIVACPENQTFISIGGVRRRLGVGVVKPLAADG